MVQIAKRKGLSLLLTLAMLISLFPTLTLPAGAALTTVYVNANTGDDSSGDGTSAKPYKTISKGYQMTPEGDILDLTGVSLESGEFGPAKNRDYHRQEHHYPGAWCGEN